MQAGTAGELAVADHTVAAAGPVTGKSAERSSGDSCGVAKEQLAASVGVGVEGHDVGVRGFDHVGCLAAMKGRCNHLLGEHLADPEDRALEGLCRGQVDDHSDRCIPQADLELVGCNLRSVVVGCRADSHGNLLCHLANLLFRHGEGRRPEEPVGTDLEAVAARIRTAELAAGGSEGEDREAAEGEGSCTAGCWPWFEEPEPECAPAATAAADGGSRDCRSEQRIASRSDFLMAKSVNGSAD